MQDVNVQDSDKLTLSLSPIKDAPKDFPLKLKAKSEGQKAQWIKQINDCKSLSKSSLSHSINETKVITFLKASKDVENEPIIHIENKGCGGDPEDLKKASRRESYSKPPIDLNHKVETLDDFHSYEEDKTVVTDSIHSGLITPNDGEKCNFCL